MKPTTFNIVHPSIAACYFLAVLVLTMSAFQPVFLGISFIAGCAYMIYLKGIHIACKSLAWQLPLLLIVVVVSPLFFSQGSTEIIRIDSYAIYAESVFYGFCMGLMLVSVMMWITCACEIITSDKLMMLTGDSVPTIGLMLSMITKLVPQFVVRGKEIQLAAEMNGVKGKNARLRHLSVLMGWSMEDSLDTAQAMRARGWGAAKKRTTYQLTRFKRRDGVVLGLLIALIVLCGVCAFAATTQYAFYPRLSTLVIWWGYIPYAILVFLPMICDAIEAILWKTR